MDSTSTLTMPCGASRRYLGIYLGYPGDILFRINRKVYFRPTGNLKTVRGPALGPYQESAETGWFLATERFFYSQRNQGQPEWRLPRQGLPWGYSGLSSGEPDPQDPTGGVESYSNPTRIRGWGSDSKPARIRLGFDSDPEGYPPKIPRTPRIPQVPQGAF